MTRSSSASITPPWPAGRSQWTPQRRAYYPGQDAGAPLSANELDRISLVVGKEGKISQRASIGEVSGSWADSVASVNTLISDLVHPTSETARVIGAVAKGDLAQTMALEIEGRPLETRPPRRIQLAPPDGEAIKTGT